MPERHDLDVLADLPTVDVIAGAAHESAAHAFKTRSSNDLPDSRVGEDPGQSFVKLLPDSIRCITTIGGPPGRRVLDLAGGLIVNSERGLPSARSRRASL